VRFLHERNVRCYIAFNTLISPTSSKSRQGPRRHSAAGCDAVIVQDVGLARLCKAWRRAAGPCFDADDVDRAARIEFVRSHLGVQRVILARELSVKEITAIHNQTSMPLEVFVHVHFA